MREEEDQQGEDLLRVPNEAQYYSGRAASPTARYTVTEL